MNNEKRKTFIITFPNKTRDCVKNVYTYCIDRKGILYLSDSNGEIIAAFRKWWCFVIKGE
jgi:hypothetical protein